MKPILLLMLIASFECGMSAEDNSPTATKKSGNCSNCKESCCYVCEYVTSLKGLKDNLDNFSTCKNFKFHLKDSSLLELTDDIFPQLGSLHKFIFQMGNSTVHLLSLHHDSHNPFNNLNFQEGVFYVEDCSTLAGWRWETLHNIPLNVGSFQLILKRSELLYLPEEFNKVAKGQVTLIRILKCRLRWLGREVFATFSELRSLELRGNLLQTIRRSQLPASDSKLEILDLGYNQLTSLPPDLFDHLTSLQTIYLEGNQLTELSGKLMVGLANANSFNIDKGTWNVRTLHRDYSLDSLMQEFQRYNLDILGLQETRWTDKGIFVNCNCTLRMKMSKLDKFDSYPCQLNRSSDLTFMEICKTTKQQM